MEMMHTDICVFVDCMLIIHLLVGYTDICRLYGDCSYICSLYVDCTHFFKLCADYTDVCRLYGNYAYRYMYLCRLYVDYTFVGGLYRYL